MHANEQLIRRFYDAFARRDLDTMRACYASDVTFEDPVFTLRGPAVMDMWTMLATGTGGGPVITCTAAQADDKTGTATWEAHYNFSQTGRKVHNVMNVRFTFADGRIATQRDHFDFWRWARQALGLPGLLLGWTSFMHNAIRKKAAGRLAAFQEKKKSA
jgi:uncharacterized protein